MFAVVALDAAARYCTSFKCTDESFAELIEQEGADPAPYMARNKWVALERFNVMSERELKALLRKSYELVYEKLPKKTKAQLES